MSDLPQSSLTSKEDGQLVREQDQESSSTNNHNHKVASSGSSAAGAPYKTYSVQDLVNTPPPTLKDRIKRHFFHKGLADRPEYLQQIYAKVPRYIYVNQPLPPQMTVGGDGSNQHPALTYPRNKIRTTKYTPLSFLPKNILFQFRNVANVYFLVLVILGAFQIFGVDSPGLAAVPLIVIVCITALKDAFEDYRRAISDSQLNNSPIHLLQGPENPNVLINEVSAWRRFKKSCSRITGKVLHGIIKACIMVFAKKERKSEFIRQEHHDNENALHRVSTIVSDYSYNSTQVAHGRPSMQSPRRSTQAAYGRPSIQSPRKSMNERRKSRLGPPPPPTKPIANTLLNPELQKENVAREQVRATFKNRRWKDVAIGDIIRVRANEEVPADVIVLSTSDAEGNCYIETKNLDGETNLKTKSCLQAGGADHLKHSNDFLSAKFWVECDAPNPNLYSFRGTVHYENFDNNGHLVNPDEKEAVTNDNVLLRGSMLRNTKWVIGLVVYTGSETKIMLNSGITPTKSSLISRELNFSVIINFLLLFVLCFISGVVNGTFYKKTDVSRIYFDFEPYSPTAAGNGVLAFFVALIIYQSLVPISLYISVEIIKTLQAFFIFSDVKMYYEKLDFPCIPKAWNISDDLGQIEYVFSDKTGTLTQNVMEFKKCSINGKSYGLAYTEAKQGLDKRDGLDTVLESEKWKAIIQKDKESMLDLLFDKSKNDQLREDAVTFVSNDYVKDTILSESGDVQKEANITFMQALALCHTVVTEPNEYDPELRDFKAESPDEAALVSVARDMGIVFKDRARKLIHISQYGEDSEYELVDIIGFTSARKRMSCIIRTPQNKYLLITKGADNVIFSRLDARANSEEVISKTALHLEDYAKEGLRTLCIAQRELDPKFYEDWSRRYKDAHASIDDSRTEVIERLTEEIETGLVLLGGTAIEDRLQAGVPDSIAILGEAGIKLWVLTGDRIETAINIGFSCNLLENNMKLLVVRPEEGDEGNVAHIDGLITQYLQENFGLLQNNTNEEVDKLITEARKDHSAPSANHALVIDGAALSLVFRNLSIDSPNDASIVRLQEKFLLLGKQCKSVICCRVSPAQKAQVVKMVKNNLGVMTLAIGDGANDVAMIQAANVGVGIAGEEGRQAVMSSDYAIGQFRFLTRLLLVHGRWSYKRLAEMVPCFFYKNITFTLTCFWYGIYNNFDGSYLFEYTFLMFFNLAFTSLPVIVLAVLDQDVSDTVSLLVPQLYRTGILGIEWSQYKFAWYMFDGLYQSVIAFFFPYLLYYKSFQNPQGLAVDHRFWIGITVCAVTVTACDIYVLLRQYRWDWLTLLIDAISILLVFFWAGAWSARAEMAQEFYKAGAQTLGTLSVWCVFFISVILCLLPRFTFDFLKSNFKPRDIEIVREMVRKGEFDNYPAGYDPTDAEDIERHRILNQLIDTDPETLQKLEREQYPEYHKEDEHHAKSPLKRTFRSIKRRTTLTKSKERGESRSRRDTLIENFRHPIDINELRRQMIQDGQYNTGGRNSLERINTTHELPGLTQAETLISYHTRNSINLR